MKLFNCINSLADYERFKLWQLERKRVPTAKKETGRKRVREREREDSFSDAMLRQRVGEKVRGKIEVELRIESKIMTGCKWMSDLCDVLLTVQ